MTVLLRKEIRSLLPTWALTMAATALIAFVDHDSMGSTALLFLIAIGSVLLGITSFGSEFSQGTFPALLVQPIPRNRIWWIKTGTLGVALLIVAIMAVGAYFCQYPLSGHAEPVIFILLFFGAAFAGGLSSTLATRQMATAFWLALLGPLAICGAVVIFNSTNESVRITNISLAAALAIYDALAFLLAHQQFLRAQDLPGASGAIISLPAWMRFGANARLSAKAPAHRPLRALIVKELQLHQVSVCVAAVLLILHIIGIFIRRMIVRPGNSETELYEFLAGWWLLWFILPVIIASSAIAEERRQGTLEGSLCLPARIRTQWFIKCAVCFFLAILFAGVMPWLLETVAQSIGCPFPIKFHNNLSPIADHWLFLGRTVLFAAIITLVSFYASSLARSLLHAVGVAILVGSVFVSFVVQVASSDTFGQGNSWLLDDFLQYALPVLFALLLGLSYNNFKHATVGRRLWLQNLAVWLFVFLLCTSIGFFWLLAMLFPHKNFL